ncbi:MAG: hypothetical protein ACLUFV_06585 [Acutalibacteraceae bacterium]
MLLDCHRLASEGRTFPRGWPPSASGTSRSAAGWDWPCRWTRRSPPLRNLRRGCSRDYAASRGEYLNGILLAFYLGYAFIDAAEVVFFDANGVFDGDRTNRVMGERLAQARNAVIPGFTARCRTARSKPFRAAARTSPAPSSRAVMADLYENWTDVSGFR